MTRESVKLAVVAVTGHDFRLFEHIRAVSRTARIMRSLRFSNASGIVFTNRSKPLLARIAYPSVRLYDVLQKPFRRDHYSAAMLGGVSQILAGIDLVDFALVVQWDGFAKNPAGWSDRFLDYDYLGAPWANRMSGNGGFSLRSRAFLEWSHSTLPACPVNRNEDWWACVTHRRLAVECGIKFPPMRLARRFSVETVGTDRDLASSFGFHSEARLKQLGF